MNAVERIYELAHRCYHECLSLQGSAADDACRRLQHLRDVIRAGNGDPNPAVLARVASAAAGAAMIAALVGTQEEDRRDRAWRAAGALVEASNGLASLEDKILSLGW
jgi:hypothetical protein